MRLYAGPALKGAGAPTSRIDDTSVTKITAELRLDVSLALFDEGASPAVHGPVRRT
ncbi:MAG: hypothetical protein AAGF19_00625 [Pseudomonadota bacterium]